MCGSMQVRLLPIELQITILELAIQDCDLYLDDLLSPPLYIYSSHLDYDWHINRLRRGGGSQSNAMQDPSTSTEQRLTEANLHWANYTTELEGMFMKMIALQRLCPVNEATVRPVMSTILEMNIFFMFGTRYTDDPIFIAHPSPPRHQVIDVMNVD